MAVMLSVLTLTIFGVAAQADPFVSTASVTSDSIVDDWGGFGNLEGRLVKPFVPGTIDVAGGISLQLTTLPADLPFFGGRKIFADALLSTQSSDRAYGGASISLLPADIDNGLRLGIEVFGPNPGRTWYLGKAFNFDW